MRRFCRFILYAALIWAVFCFQSALSASLSRFGAAIDFLSPVVGCVAVLEPMGSAAFFGLLAGFFRDTGSYSGVFYMPALYFLAAAVSRLGRERFFPKIPVCAAACGVMLLVPECLSYFLFRLPYRREPFTVFSKYLLFEGVSSAAMFFPTFFICKWIHSIFPAEEKPVFSSVGAQRIKSVLIKNGGRR